MASKDLYAVLGVDRGATKKDIRQAYRRLARQYHPDVNPGDTAAEARFKDINAAYEVLSDSDKRKKYDKYGDQWPYADQIEEMRKKSGGTRTFRFGDGGVAFDFADLGGMPGDLGDIFGGRGRGRTARRTAPAEYPVDITLDEAFRGTTRTLQIAGDRPCATCGGTGEIANAVCHVCQGSGVTTASRRLEVKIPPGVDTGSRVRVAGDGAVRGNVYLVVTVRPDPRFERRGADLYVDVDVPLTAAVLGGEVEVPTLTGRVALKVPPLTQNGKVFRLAHLGMPGLGGHARGDLFARVRVKLPDSLDDKERQLFEELKAAGV